MTPPDPTLDLRVRPTVVKALRALYDEMQQTQRGRLIFLAGAPGSGRCATLQAAQATLTSAAGAPLVVRGSFDGVASPTVREALVQRLGERCLPPPAGSLPLADLLVPLLAGAEQLRAVRAAWERQGSPTLERPDLFYLALTYAAYQQPVVCLVDAFEAARAPWFSFFLRVGRELAVLPLLVVLTLDTPATPTTDPDAPSAQQVAQWLVARGLAQWLPLPLVDEMEVMAALGPLAPDLARQLLALAGRNPQRLLDLWEVWRSRGVIVWQETSEGGGMGWVVAEGQAAATASVMAALVDGPGVANPAKVRALLGLGGQAGRTFAVEAVAEAAGQTTEAVLAHLRPLVGPPAPSGLLAAADAAGDDPRYLTFLSEAVWRLCQGADDPARGMALAQVLARLSPHPDAEQLRRQARLARAGGDSKLWARYQQRTEGAPTIAALMADAEALHALGETLEAGASAWDAADMRLAGWLAAQLLASGWHLHGSLPPHQQQALFRGAEVLAAQAALRRVQVAARAAIEHVARAWHRVSGAQALLEQQATQFRALGDLLGEAVALSELAPLAAQAGQPGVAAPACEQALACFQVAESARGEATTFWLRARLALAGGPTLAALALVFLAAWRLGEIGDEDFPVVQALAARTADQLGLHSEERGRLAQVVQRAYEEDRGWGLVHALAASP